MKNNCLTIRIGSRSSPLARVQVEEVLSLLKKAGSPVDTEVTYFDTHGDRDKTTSLTERSVPDNFFTDTLDQALLMNEIDVSINSAKDLPENLDPNLEIFALTAPTDASDCFSGREPFKDLPPGAKVGTSSELRQSQIKILRPDIEIVDIRGTIEERLALVDQGKCDGIIVATIALKRLGLENRITDVMPWPGTPLQGQLAVVGRTQDRKIRNIFAPIDVRRQYGQVTLVGAGPGDPELITLKGVRALAQADVVFYDYLLDRSLLEHAPSAEKIYVGKRKGAHSMPQEKLSQQICAKAMAGKKVVRLKGGDPLIFGRGADEIQQLRAFHIPVEVIPGVSSATGIPSTLAVPLTARALSSSVAFISGHGEKETKDDPQPIKIPDTDTLVFLMGLTKLPMIVKSLMANQWRDDTPVMIVSRGTYHDEQIVVSDLKSILKKVEKANIQPPALIVVGQTVSLYRGDQRKTKQSAQFLYTGTHPEKYQSLGHVVHFPMIDIVQTEAEKMSIKSTLNDLNQYDVVLFTSRFAVKYFLETLKEEGVELTSLSCQWASIGTATTLALRSYGIDPDVQAFEETSLGMFDALLDQGEVKNKRILFPRSSLSNPYLKQALEKRGARVDEVTAYVNQKPLKRPLPDTSINSIIFTSPSTVKNFLEDYGSIPHDWKILSKGPVTQEFLQKSGYQSEVLIYE